MSEQKFLIETAELEALLNSDRLLLLDVTAGPVKSGEEELPAREAWLREHLPGSRWLDQKLLTDSTSPYPYVAPPAETLVRKFEELGVADGVQVVLYSASGYGWAARVWLLLYSLGFATARVLNGGLQKWRAEGRPLQQGETPTATPRPGKLGLSPKRAVFADKARVLQMLGNADAQILDALSADQYSGKVPGKYGRSGHIAGALNVPNTSLIDVANNTFKDAESTQAVFAAAGIARDKPIIAYCGAGIAASIDAFAALRAGWQDVRVYQESLAEWASDPELPMEPA